jgi:hypothetical protein
VASAKKRKMPEKIPGHKVRFLPSSEDWGAWSSASGAV